MMMLAAAAGGKLALGEAATYALLGYAVVFFGIVLLMIVVMIMGKIFVAKASRQKAAAAAKQAAEPAPAPVPAGKPAPGSAGELKLYDTDPRTAAMVMAIVANKLQKPLNELRFKSIKEVK